MAGPLHIFRAGTYTDMRGNQVTLSDGDVAAAARAYDPARHQAPIVVGHPKDNSPAFGWLGSLAADGADLTAEPIDVDQAFAQAVRAGRYKKISASFWSPNAEDNPVPGVWYLRHLGFLGGAAPAVEGLRGVDLAADASDLSVTIDMYSHPFAKEKPMAETAPKTTPDKPQPDTVDLAGRTAELDRRQAELDAAKAEQERRQAELDAREAKARRSEIASFVAGIAAEGRVLPADEAPLVTLLADLPEEGEGHMDFAAPCEDGGAQKARPPGIWLRDWLKRLPVQVDFGERSAGDNTDTGPVTADFAAPDGYSVAPETAALHNRALAYQAEHPNTDYLDAVKAVAKR